MTLIGTDNESNRVAWVTNALSDLPSGWRLLDAGAGEQRFRGNCGHLDYVSQDFAQYVPNAESKRGLQMPKWDYGDLDLVCDIIDIPEPNESFDAILCTEVLEHVPNAIAVLEEFARLLRPEGKLIVTVPFISLTHFAPYHFATGFNRFFFEEHLQRLGFQVDTVMPNGNFFKLVAQEVRRVGGVANRYEAGKRRWYERMATKVVLKMLDRFSQHDRGSAELGCFGTQLIATKLTAAATQAA